MLPAFLSRACHPVSRVVKSSYTCLVRGSVARLSIIMRASLFAATYCLPVVLQANPVPPDAQSVASGQMLYERHCSDCHGWNVGGAGEELYAQDDGDDLSDFADLIDIAEARRAGADSTADAAGSYSSVADATLTSVATC